MNRTIAVVVLLSAAASSLAADKKLGEKPSLKLPSSESSGLSFKSGIETQPQTDSPAPAPIQGETAPKLAGIGIHAGPATAVPQPPPSRGQGGEGTVRPSRGASLSSAGRCYCSEAISGGITPYRIVRYSSLGDCASMEYPDNTAPWDIGVPSCRAVVLPGSLKITPDLGIFFVDADKPEQQVNEFNVHGLKEEDTVVCYEVIAHPDPAVTRDIMNKKGHCKAEEHFYPMPEDNKEWQYKRGVWTGIFKYTEQEWGAAGIVTKSVFMDKNTKKTVSGLLLVTDGNLTGVDALKDLPNFQATLALIHALHVQHLAGGSGQASCGKAPAGVTCLDIGKAPPLGGHIDLKLQGQVWALRFISRGDRGALNYPFSVERRAGAGDSTVSMALSAKPGDFNVPSGCRLEGLTYNPLVIEAFVRAGRYANATLSSNDNRTDRCVLEKDKTYFFNVKGRCSDAGDQAKGCPVMASVANSGIFLLDPGGVSVGCATRGGNLTPEGGCRQP